MTGPDPSRCRRATAGLRSHCHQLRVEQIAAGNLIRELRRGSRSHVIEYPCSLGSGHLRPERSRSRLENLRGCSAIKQAATQDLGEVRVVVDRRSLGTTDKQGIEFLTALLPGLIEVDVVRDQSAGRRA